MAQPRTSVIIPVRNGAKFIAEAIRSALPQLNQADEVIVVDDASTDDTRAVVALTQDFRVRLLEGPQRGPSSARNLGLATATGDFIAFLDHDDLWPSDRHKVLFSILLDNPEVDVAYGRMRIRFDGIEPTARWQALDGDSQLLNRLCTSLFRRRTLDRIGSFDESMRFAEDSDYVLRLVEAGSRMRSCDADTLIYRRHLTNSTSDREAAREGQVKFFHRRIMRRRRNANSES